MLLPARRPSLDTVLAAYLAAHLEDQKATAAMDRAEQLFRRLRRSLPDDDAYRLAGVNLADRRSLQAAKMLCDCRDALFDALPGTADLCWDFFAAVGAIQCCEQMPVPANQNRKRTDLHHRA
ncbi:MAG TPA: hypothetical protein VJQ06_02045 [Rhizomicrobium sp.]|nr:hypothetical protein [Rhizomicrobium sp.]